jgi:hypothetical protein
MFSLQSINVFDSAADRDAHLIAPTRGQVVLLRDTGELLVYYSQSIGWRPPWNLPWGEQGYSQVTTVIVLNATNPGIFICAVTFTPVVNRIYRVEFDGDMISAEGQTFPPDVCDLQVWRSDIANLTPVTIADYSTFDLIANTNRPFAFAARDLTANPGVSTTYTLYGASSTADVPGVGSSINATSLRPTSLRVVDVGPSGNPPT